MSNGINGQSHLVDSNAASNEIASIGLLCVSPLCTAEPVGVTRRTAASDDICTRADPLPVVMV